VPPIALRRTLTHATLVCACFSLLFCWVFARPLLDHTYPAESDLDAYYLPAFLAPPAVWSPFEFAGTPAFADPENAVFYPPHVLFARLLGSWTGFLVCAYVLAACFMYAYVFAHTRSVAAAALAGTAFSLSEALIERLPHPTILHAVAWLPLILLSLDRVIEGRRRWMWVAIGSCASASCVLAGHPQLPLYVAYLCALYVLAGMLVERPGAGAAAAVLVMGVGAALLSAPALWPLVEASRDIERQTVTFNDFISYANSGPQMLSMLFPTIEHPGLEAPTYVGMAVLMLAPLGAFRFREGWRAGFWIVVAVIALCLGAGVVPVSRIAFALPLYDHFRIASRHLILSSAAFAVLAGFALAAIERRRVTVRGVVWSTGAVLIAIVVTAALLASHPHSVQFDSARRVVLAVWNLGVWIQLALAAAAACLCVLMARGRRPQRWAVLVVALTIADLLHAQPKAVTTTGIAVDTLPAAALQPSVHARRLRDELAPAHQRLLAAGGLHPNEVVAGPWARVWRIPMASGYSSISLQSVDALEELGSGGRVTAALLSSNDAALDLLAVRYLVVDPAALRPAEAAELSTSGRWQPVDRFMTSRSSDRVRDETVAGETEYAVFENRRARPLAWLTREVLPVTDGQMEDAVRQSVLPGRRAFDPADVALVDEGRLPALAYPRGDADVHVESLDSETIRVRVSSTGGGFLVLSEAYLPGWRARIDQQPPMPVSRTDSALQGIDVPAGNHLVMFEFVPDSRRAGLLAGGVGLLLTIVVFVVGLLAPRESTVREAGAVGA
jgi:hypothetical protein